MILQALDEYYKRRRELGDPDDKVAPTGWEWKEIPFLVVIDREGNFKALEDTRERKGKKLVAKPFLVPLSSGRTREAAANLLWDTVEYALGANPRGRGDIEQRHNAFRDKILKELDYLVDEYPLNPIVKFLENSPLSQIEASKEYAGIWGKMFKGNVFTTFKISGDDNIALHAIKKRIKHERSDQLEGLCIVTGQRKPIARLHPKVKGVNGTREEGGLLVSFNHNSFNSFNKEQGYNSPVSEEVAFSYTTALNMLLAKDSKNKTLTGDATTVFWSQKHSEGSFNLEEEFAWYVADPPKDDPDRGVRAVRGLMNAMKTGHLPVFDDNRFFILGLSPNAARISIRFWRTGTVREFGEKILKHFEDIAVDREPNDPEYLTINQLLRATALEYKMDNVPPNLSGSVMASILDGTPYPVALLQQCMRRVRAEREVTYRRASIIKGYLTRKQYFPGGLGMSLDKAIKDPGYLTGRLFAVLERIQKRSSPSVKATIRDRFYGAASSSPVTVFPQLLKLKNHHLEKLEGQGLKTYFEKEVGEIIDLLDCFPSHLSLTEQAAFAIGYYHQRQDLFKKKTQENEGEGSASND